MADGGRGGLLRQWWNQRDDYQWRVEFLHSRGLLPVLSWLIAGLGAVLSVFAAVNIFVPPVNDGLLFRIGWVVVSVGTLAWAARWVLLPWPNARASAWLVAAFDLLMTVRALLFGDPNLAMPAISALLCVGCYVVFFHGPRLHLAHMVWCTAAVLGIDVWLAASTPEYGLRVAASWAVVALAVAVLILPSLQFGFWLLQGSSIQSLNDPLTELTNRRGLALAVSRLNERSVAWLGLCALLIDIDGFKRINDDFGHAAGDEVLIRTSRRIRASVGPNAVVARWGGEEFLVLERISSLRAAEIIAERIRAAVSEPGVPTVTVSIGVAICDTVDSGVEKVISVADWAMYEAKAQGGNQVVATAGAL